MYAKIAAPLMTMTAVIGLAVAGVAGVSPAAATSPTKIGGCPTAYDLLSVEHMESIGPYILPRLVDTSGNNNGYVCGLVLPVAAQEADCKNGGRVACELLELRLPYYHMRDDDVPGMATA